MTAVLIPTSSEAEWLEARRQGVTASEIAIVMGLSPYSSPYKLFHQKTGVLPPDDDSAAMERGRVLEPYIADKFATLRPELALMGSGRELFAHPERRWQLATPDRQVCELLTIDPYYGHTAYGDLLGVLECKTDAGSDEWGEPGTDEIPVHYRAQVLWQMDVMGVGHAYVACLRIRQWDVRVYELHIDDDALADLKLMRDAARDFLDRIDTGDPPDIDWRPATLAALKTLHPSVEDTDAEVSVQLAAWYHAACRNHKHWEQRKKLYEARIREQMGSARRAVIPGPGRRVFARRDVYPVREHVRKASVTDKLVPVYPKETKTS